MCVITFFYSIRFLYTQFIGIINKLLSSIKGVQRAERGHIGGVESGSQHWDRTAASKFRNTFQFKQHFMVVFMKEAGFAAAISICVDRFSEFVFDTAQDILHLL